MLEKLQLQLQLLHKNLITTNKNMKIDKGKMKRNKINNKCSIFRQANAD
jgi:hypothetical protein